MQTQPLVVLRALPDPSLGEVAPLHQTNYQRHRPRIWLRIQQACVCLHRLRERRLLWNRRRCTATVPGCGAGETRRTHPPSNPFPRMPL